MPDWLSILILGLVEGVTEFLPVSSTGHLLLVEHWIGHRSEFFNVIIQSAAVLAVLAAFRERVTRWATTLGEPATRDALAKIAVAFVITGIGGLALKKAGLRLSSENPVPVATATLVGGVLFLVVEHFLKGRPTRDDVSWPAAVAVAAAQLLAIACPGSSRSGSAILFALAMGVSRPAATEFAFLLGVPTLLAAGGKEFIDAVKSGEPHEPWGLIALGCVVSAASAFVVVKWLLGYVRSHRFTGFAIYRIVLGGALLLSRLA
ncbi:MAG: undecaprenyl-diphosphate phosphatase [Verrucomicrobiota bacterium]